MPPWSNPFHFFHGHRRKPYRRETAIMLYLDSKPTTCMPRQLISSCCLTRVCERSKRPIRPSEGLIARQYVTSSHAAIRGFVPLRKKVSKQTPLTPHCCTVLSSVLLHGLVAQQMTAIERLVSYLLACHGFRLAAELSLVRLSGVPMRLTVGTRKLWSFHWEGWILSIFGHDREGLTLRCNEPCASSLGSHGRDSFFFSI
ncbi:hypothetical protein F5Y15DRAFT_215327 [Xylariaceae sp. FL0016]|nr:hypothetical protein F5Y15DRAFT_215327 [Xylariaceae sp. FL0016]